MSDIQKQHVVSVEEAISIFSTGAFVAVSDHADREDEADLIIAAESITAEQMAFLIRWTSGIICVPMLKERMDALEMPLLTDRNTALFGTPFGMPVDVIEGTRGGVSAEERTLTVQALVNPDSTSQDFGRPGHVFPLQAHPGGILARDGHTEAGVYLAQQAGMQPLAVIGELMSEDGAMMRGDVLHRFLQQYSIPWITIDDLQAHARLAQ